MKLRLAVLAGLVLAGQAHAQTAADAYYDPAAMQAARDALRKSHGAAVNWMVLGERLEYDIDDDSIFVWEGQGWIGGDINRAWFKTEGAALDGSVEDFELAALYSRAIAPFWDLQVGIRHDFEPDSRSFGMLAIQGLAPYWFELDAALFLSEEGDVSTRLEAEYDLRLTQRLVLQPRLELNAALMDDDTTGVRAGLATSQFGLRLRYEFRREFAPYVGVSWSRAHGDTRAEAEETERNSVLLGLRFWF